MDGITSRATSEQQSEHTGVPPHFQDSSLLFLILWFLLELRLTSVHRRDVNRINLLRYGYTLVNAVQPVQTISSSNFHAEFNSP